MQTRLAVGALAAAGVALPWPRSQIGLIRVLAATALVYLAFRLAIPWIIALSKLRLTSEQKYWVYRGPGNGVVGLLPSAAVLLAGRFLFGFSLREQWNGRLAFSWRDVWYGVTVATISAGVALLGAAVAGSRVLGTELVTRRRKCRQQPLRRNLVAIAPSAGRPTSRRRPVRDDLNGPRFRFDTRVELVCGGCGSVDLDHRLGRPEGRKSLFRLGLSPGDRRARRFDDALKRAALGAHLPTGGKCFHAPAHQVR